jgi:hypothetical protein
MKNLILWSLLLISIPTLSQKNLLFETKEYKHAYRNGTRSRDGLPGEKYWQNTSDYKITAEFDPQNHLISGHLTMAYHNQSPDSLNTMVFKLMQNLYQKGASRQMPVNPDMLHDGIKISNLKYEEQRRCRIEYVYFWHGDERAPAWLYQSKFQGKNKYGLCNTGSQKSWFEKRHNRQHLIFHCLLVSASSSL